MKSIKTKLWTGMMILVLIVIILIWFFQIVFLEKFYTNMKITQIKNTGYSIVEQINDLRLIDDDFKDSIDKFSYDNNLSIEILDTRGVKIYESTSGFSRSTNMMENMMKNRVINQAFYEVLKYKEVVIPLNHHRFSNKFMLIGIPIVISDQIEGVAFINMPLVPIEETAFILKRQLVYITSILLISSLVISFLISRTFTKPILEIKKVSQKIAKGDFSYKITYKSEDEVGDLAQTINYMGNELSKIEQLRKDLIANISHELRTPLSLIQGYAETIKDVSGENKEKREKHIGIIIDESKRLGRIVNDILNLSQMQSGNSKLNQEKFSLNKLVKRVLKTYEVLSENTDINLIANVEEIEIIADESKIEQVMYNLINNAFNYTEQGGEIKISTFREDEHIVVEVKDTGVGIEEKDIEHVWDRYYKKDNVSKKGTIGTGLGLSIVKSILEQHKALYGVKSKKHIGTTFWFKIKI